MPNTESDRLPIGTRVIVDGGDEGTVARYNIVDNRLHVVALDEGGESQRMVGALEVIDTKPPEAVTFLPGDHVRVDPNGERIGNITDGVGLTGTVLDKRTLEAGDYHSAVLGTPAETVIVQFDAEVNGRLRFPKPEEWGVEWVVHEPDQPAVEGPEGRSIDEILQELRDARSA